MSVNIGANNADDAFYRYKMPKLVAKIEGRGNGIKTNVVNNVDIAKALARPPEYIIKYFGGELGAQTRFDPALGTSIVNGAHDAAKLVELLEGFIKRYVQCYSCGNPETVIRCKKENITLKCKACGAKSEVDPRLKLNSFIIKNPPPSELTKADKQEAKIKARERDRLKGLEDGEVKEKKEKKEKKSKEEKEKKRKKEREEGAPEDAPQEGQEGSASASEDSDDDTEWLADTSAEAAAARAREQLSAATAALVVGGDAIAAEASSAPAPSAPSTSNGVSPSVSPAPSADVEALVEALQSQCTLEEASRALRGLLGNKKASEIGALYAELEVEGSGGPAAKARALYEALFLNTEGKLPALMDKYKLVLKACAPDEDAMAQACQLIALEHLVGVSEPQRIKETPFALKVLFEFGIVDEEVIEGWADSAKAGKKLLGIPSDVAKAVREAAEPFLTWLAEAESDDEDEDDE